MDVTLLVNYHASFRLRLCVCKQPGGNQFNQPKMISDYSSARVIALLNGLQASQRALAIRWSPSLRFAATPVARSGGWILSLGCVLVVTCLGCDSGVHSSLVPTVHSRPTHSASEPEPQGPLPFPPGAPSDDAVRTKLPRQQAGGSPDLATEVGEQEAGHREPNLQPQLACVRIHQRLGGQLGCGVIVAQSSAGFDVLTANHVVTNARSWWIESVRRDEKSDQITTRRQTQVKVLARDRARDLAYVRVTSDEAPSASLFIGKLEQDAAGAEITKFSAEAVFWLDSKLPMSEFVEVVSRMQARRTKADQATSLWKVGRLSEPGMSGSGLVDSNGRLIGIASGNSGGFAYYASDDALADFLKENGLRE